MIQRGTWGSRVFGSPIPWGSFYPAVTGVAPEPPAFPVPNIQVAAESRTITAAAEHRTLAVVAESRTLHVLAE